MLIEFQFPADAHGSLLLLLIPIRARTSQPPPVVVAAAGWPDQHKRTRIINFFICLLIGFALVSRCRPVHVRPICSSDNESAPNSFTVHEMPSDQSIGIRARLKLTYWTQVLGDRSSILCYNQRTCQKLTTLFEVVSRAMTNGPMTGEYPPFSAPIPFHIGLPDTGPKFPYNVVVHWSVGWLTD